VIDLGHEVVRRLGVDLEPVEVERRAVDDRPGGARRLDGDVEHGMQRLRHGGDRVSREALGGGSPQRGCKMNDCEF